MIDYKEKVFQAFLESNIVFTSDELSSIEYADFGLSNFENEGLNLIVYENNDRYCAKEMVLLPYQTCPEHLHPNRNGEPGKQETFRCRKGSVVLFVEGESNGVTVKVPEEKEKYYTVKHGIVLKPGEQYTILPNTKHWFQAGDEGAIISEFSSNSDDASDVFTDPNVKRVN